MCGMPTYKYCDSLLSAGIPTFPLHGHYTVADGTYYALSTLPKYAYAGGDGRRGKSEVEISGPTTTQNNQANLTITTMVDVDTNVRESGNTGMLRPFHFLMQ